MPRLLSDPVVEGIVARDGIVGVLPLNSALDPTWNATDGKKAVTLDAVVDAIDAVCQIAGDAQHVGIGTDFDGGQGAESSPLEIDTIADLPKLAEALAGRGFPENDIADVMGRNWLRFLGRQLPSRSRQRPTERTKPSGYLRDAAKRTCRRPCAWISPILFIPILSGRRSDASFSTSTTAMILGPTSCSSPATRHALAASVA